jgi:hypothetical protein
MSAGSLPLGSPAAAVIPLAAVVAGLAVLVVTGALTGAGEMTSAPSSVPDIPARYLVLYRDAAARHRLGADGWSYLAGVGKVECDHGRSQLPGCHSGSNYAGAQGPAQFLASTWAMYGVDGDGDGRRDVYDPVDAIPGMARYLRASGAPADWRRALFAYNHDTAYVARVLQIAAGYRAAAAQPAPIAGHVLAGEGTWLAPIPGFPGERCDARIVPDVVALSRRRSYYPLLTTRN